MVAPVSITLIKWEAMSRYSIVSTILGFTHFKTTDNSLESKWALRRCHADRKKFMKDYYGLTIRYGC